MSKKPSPQKKRNRALIVWKRWGDWRKLAIAVATGIFIAAILTIPLLPDRISVVPDTLATEDIVAPRAARYPDPNKTALLQQLIASQVQPVYSTVINTRSSAREAVASFFSAAAQVRSGTAPEPEERKVEAIRKQLPELDPKVARTALRLTQPQFDQASSRANALIEETMRLPIRPDAVDQARDTVRARAAALPAAPAVRTLVGEVVALNVVSNQVYNDQETEEARRRERDRVPLQFETIKRGDVLIRRGERITADHLYKLEQVGLIQERPNPVTLVSLTLLAFGLVAVFCLYLYQFHPKVLRSFSSLLLLAVVVCGTLLLFRIGSTALGLSFSVEQLGFLGMSCSALGAMLIAALLCPQIAVFMGVALALLTSVLVGADLKFAILSIVSSLVGVQCVTTIRNRAGILRTSLTLSAVNVVTALVAQGATQASLPGDLWQNVLWAGIGGFLSAMLFVFFAAMLERPFRLTTHLTLLELSDPSHPLLQRLSTEAPGTYAHSIGVANLSEAAAEAIGADGLFCRVASYYHDVGKVVRPQFFVENQIGENRHNSINPSLSSLVVTSHVKDGVELAEEHRLPPPIISIIREHHGTCLIKYFYHRAVTEGAEDNTTALEYQFRYEGPRPQTKESGVIMIADSAEAASRTLEKPTPGRIRDMIEYIVRDRLADGQLDECELTFKDLEKIISAMTRALTSYLHARIEYPEGDTNQLRRLAADGAAGKEPVGVQKALSDTPEAAAGAFEGPAGL